MSDYARRLTAPIGQAEQDPNESEHETATGGFATRAPPVAEPIQRGPGPIDVVVVGGGNAGLCAALTARRGGAHVVLVEAAPEHMRGGNSRHTRNLRYAHGTSSPFLTGPYTEDEFWRDLLEVTGGETDEGLARMLIRESLDLGGWMEAQGARFQPALQGTLNLARTNAFFLGGGKALVNAYYRTARRLGVEVFYETEVVAVEHGPGDASSLVVRRPNGSEQLRAKAIVFASGGFEANLDWLSEYWGEAARNFVVRGTPYNRGRTLRALHDIGARPVGSPREFHAIALDARAPRFDGGIVTRLDCVPFGIVVNRDGRRFYDEGEALWPKRYAIWGGLIAEQPEQMAYCILDSRALDKFMPSVFAPIEAGSIEDLARTLGLDPTGLSDTVKAYNRATRPHPYDPARLDGCGTEGLVPPKTNWALPLDVPPYFAYPLRPGITFTYLGVAVNERARVLAVDGAPLSNAFAAGEMIAGNILGRGYLAGLGMTIGTVFGRIAGREAARHAVA
jgi:tricarballylate dehydrogenase